MPEYFLKPSSVINKEFERIEKNHRKKVRRLKNRIANMIVGNDCLFLTLTFTDKVLEKTSADSRRQYVKKFLKLFNVPYVANIDFGAKKGREHYHAILQLDKIDYHLWKYGTIKGLKVRNDIKVDENGCITSETIERLSRYVAKLTNHAIKATTKRCSIMYSRLNGMQKRLEHESNIVALFNDNLPELPLNDTRRKRKK